MRARRRKRTRDLVYVPHDDARTRDLVFTVIDPQGQIDRLGDLIARTPEGERRRALVRALNHMLDESAP